MQQVEELRRRTEERKDRIRQAKIAMERTWWDHSVEHVSSSAPAAGHMAVSTVPFSQDVPDGALSGILPSEDVDSSGKLLKKACLTSTGEGGRHRIEHSIGFSLVCGPSPRQSFQTIGVGSFWPTLGRNKSYCRVLVAVSGPLLAVTNRTAESWWHFVPYLLPGLGGSFWPTLAITNRTAGSGWLFPSHSWAVTNRTAESCWLFLAHSWMLQIVLPSFGGCFLPILGRDNAHCRVLVAVSGPLLPGTNRIAESW